MNVEPLRDTPVTGDLCRHVHVVHGAVHPMRRNLKLDQLDLAVAQGSDHAQFAVAEELNDPARAPRGGGDRLQSKPLVDLGAAWIVQSSHDLRHVEDVARHPRDDDVQVVAGRHGSEGVGALCPGASQHLAVAA